MEGRRCGDGSSSFCDARLESGRPGVVCLPTMVRLTSDGTDGAAGPPCGSGGDALPCGHCGHSAAIIGNGWDFDFDGRWPQMRTEILQTDGKPPTFNLQGLAHNGDMNRKRAVGTLLKRS